jgi:uncharacterized protein
MHVDGSHTFAAQRDRVFAMITDPEVLKSVLPGCQEFTRTGDGTYLVVLSVNLVAFSATVRGDVTFSKVVAPESYHVFVTGKGSLGSLAIDLDMALAEKGEATAVSYAVEIEATGALGAMGPVVIQPAAGTILSQFMAALEKRVVGPEGPTPAGA